MARQFSLARWAVPVLTAAVLAACGGSDDNTMRWSGVVNFGDSLSDVGSYRVGTVAALGGGKYTINGATGLNWTELSPSVCLWLPPVLPRRGCCPISPVWWEPL